MRHPGEQAEIELILGPAGAGKTARVRNEFRREVAKRQAEGRFGTALWITPTKRARQQVLKSLLDEALTVCFAPQIVTFEEFAENLLRTAPTAVRPLSRVAKRKLLRDLINDLKRRRKLKYFAAVAETPGFLELCVSFIAELKREEIWPEEFEAACHRVSGYGRPDRAASAKDRELALIYQTYQQKLHQADGKSEEIDVASGLYDSEGRFWSARTLMQSGHRGPYRELTLVAVDGFTDFTRTQYEILATLAKWSPRLLVTLPLDAAGQRPDLFAKSAAALQELRSTFGRHAVKETVLNIPQSAQKTPFGQISLHLFVNPREVPKCKNAKGLRLFSCIRPSGEIEAIARDIKQRLLDGVAADDMVVAFRSLDGVADTVRETFAAAGVPVVVDRGPAISRSGIVRLLLSILDLEREEWPFLKLNGLLHSWLFRPDWPGIADRSAARAVAATLRRLNLDGGREVILAALERRMKRDLEENMRRPPTHEELPISLAFETVRRLSNELAPLRSKAKFADWVDRLLHLAAVFRMAPDDEQNLEKELIAERGSWQAFVRLIEEAKKAETLAGGPGRLLDLVEFRRQLLELLAGQTWETNEPETGRVRVLAAEQVRALDVPHLYLCGLSESSFPQSRGDDCLYGEADRHRLNEQGLRLGHRVRRSREEMLLFYGVVTRARKSLTLSFPSLSDGGEPLFPSPYVTAVSELFESESLTTESRGQLDPVPNSLAECMTEAELRVLATRQALEGDAELFATLADRPESEQAALNIVAAAEMAAARFATRGLTNYEGWLSDPKNLKRLARRFGRQHEFSASELETYAAHPFRFLLQCVLGLEALVDPGPATDHARRGSTLHQALAALHRKLAEEALQAVSADSLAESLRHEIEARLAPGGDSPLHQALRHIERDLLAKYADRYGGQWKMYLEVFNKHWDSPPRPAHLEVPFGNPHTDDQDETNRIHPVVEFGADGEAVRVCGRIDRIDVGVAAGRPVFNVVDYKLSRSPHRFTPDELELGRSLQLAVYAAAARRLGLVDGELFQLGFWSLGGNGFLCGLKTGTRTFQPLEAETAAMIEETLDRVLPQLAASIRRGQFPIVTDDPDEKYYPDHAAVARVGPFRAVADILEKHQAP
jgi:ATP-dependent helicase/nuclease subunit B